ncbi:MAG TPA: HEAT repeat domain-containing protein, partial [Gemmataceae bacterium]|nr:HEAT repeat domain-containing protein [Gemmataceae bacterium]
PAMNSAPLLFVALTAPAPLEPAWYSPHELLTALSARDRIDWAVPEMLSGRAWVGGELSTKDILDLACKQWGLSWTEANRIVVVHRADDGNLARWTAQLAGGGPGATAAAWELGWSRDARALPPLAEALASQDPAVALAAAQAIETLLTDIPLGREERVGPPLSGRLSLARAFPPKIDLLPLLDSPYPPVRAAALRVLIGQGGATTDRALRKAGGDRAAAVRQVRQQLIFPVVHDRTAPKPPPLPYPPEDPAARKAAVAKMVEELPGLERQSAWEEMVRRAETLAAWSRAGHDEATDALIELTGTKLQQFWYPGIVQKNLATSGGERVRAATKDLMPRALRPYIVRGLEESYWGEGLVALTGPYLSEQTVCLVTTRKAGREAIELLLPLAEKGDPDAIDALAVVGGPRAVEVLRRALAKDDPHSATLAFRSAKALGRIGTADALDALLAAADSTSLHRRHAAVLGLGRIGGPKAEAKLKAVVEDEKQPRLVRAAAADGLAQIGTPDVLAAAAAFYKADAGPPPLVYDPRNPRFGPDFPVNRWVDLKITVQAQGWGEIGWNYDPANRLFFRYGGCTGPYNNELTVFDLGTEQFVQRRPIELMAGWGDARPGNGCSVGRTWDPWRKVAWIRHGIGGTPNQLGMAEYHSRSPAARFAAYNLATDRFRAVAYHEAPYGEPATRLVCDWKHGLVFPVKLTHVNHKTKDFWAMDVRAEDVLGEPVWKNLTNPDGDYPRFASYQTAAVDQDAGLLVVYIPPFETRPPQTWVYDPEKNLWKDMQPPVQPEGVPGAGLVYDPFHKVLLLHSGRKVTQFGGPDDAITWSYDVRTNTWTDLKAANGPGNPWVGAMDFDPEHNVLVLFNFKDKRVWAYRHKPVAVGTRAP